MPYPPFTMPGAQPFFARGGSTGVLVMHGFTATPNEVLWLAQHLAGQGHTVFAPRLAGHGTDYRDLTRARWQDWVASALDGVAVLRAQCDRVVVSGLSMGGTLALITASHTAVEGVVALAAPVIVFPGARPSRLRLLKRVRPFSDQTDRSPFADYVVEQQKLRGDPALGRVRYNIWSTAGVEQLMRLIDAARTSLPDIAAPVLAVYSRGDATVLPHHLDALKSGLTRARTVEAHLLEHSSHILTQDTENESVFNWVSAFVANP